MRLRIVRAVNDQRLSGTARQLDAQLGGDRFGNFILDREDVVEFAVILLGPRLQPVLHID